MEKEELKFHMRLRVFREEVCFGPGMAKLMLLVQETESLSAACREMKMAYSKAWKIIKKAEADLGFILMESRRGGENGGSTYLTKDGEDFLKAYLDFEAEAQKAAAVLFDKYFGG